MNDQNALLRAIIDEPDDDTPRLVYADWLQEQGGAENIARAEFIRVQCQLAKLDPGDPKRPALQRKAEQLARGRKTAWRSGLPKLRGVTWGEFTRGFVGTVTLSSAYFFRVNAKRAVAAAPVHTVIFRPDNFPRSLNALAASPALDKVTELYLDHLRLDAESLSHLAQSKHAQRLRVLGLRGSHINAAGATLIARSSAFPSLKILDLGNNGLGADAVEALVGSALLAGLDLLRLDGNRFGKQGRIALRQRFGDRLVLEPDRTAER